MIPALYKRTRSASMSTLSGSSSLHRKTRSVSIGDIKPGVVNSGGVTSAPNEKVSEEKGPKQDHEGTHTPLTESGAGMEEPIRRVRHLYLPPPIHLVFHIFIPFFSLSETCQSGEPLARTSGGQKI